MNEKDYIIKFDKPPSMYWSMKTKIEFLERRIIIYSILYYRFSVSAISDFDYDKIQKQLYDLILKNQNDFKESRYYYCFYDFQGSTAYDIPHRLNDEDSLHLTNIAWGVSDQHRRYQERMGFV